MTDVRRLPTPVADMWDWQMRAACRDQDTATFFHPDRERGPAHARRERRAKQVCAECPVRAQCRAHALSVREPYGVWGGLSESERLKILRADGLHRRHRGRDPLAVPTPAPNSSTTHGTR